MEVWWSSDGLPAASVRGSHQWRSQGDSFPGFRRQVMKRTLLAPYSSLSRMELWDALYWQKKKEELPLLSKKNLLRALSHSDLRQWVLSKYTRIWDSISLHWQIIHKVWQCIDNWTIEKQLFPKYTLGKYTLGKYTVEKYTLGKYTLKKYTLEK